MRLHHKLEGVLRIRPDVLVVPECACPEVLLRRVPELGVSGIVWTGLSARKGLAVLTFGAWRVALDRAHDPRGATSLAARVTGPAELRLAAVWALPRAPEALAPALERLSGFLRESPAAIAGDFNDALVRTSARGQTGPSPLARRIEALGFTSAHHRAHGQAPGEEGEPTLYLRRRHGLARHRDLILLDRVMARGLVSVTVGTRSTWTGASDHVPVVAALDTRLW